MIRRRPGAAKPRAGGCGRGPPGRRRTSPDEHPAAEPGEGVEPGQLVRRPVDRDGLAGVLDRVGEACDEVDDVRAVEGAREEEVAEREAVQDCWVRSAATRWRRGRGSLDAKGKEHSRTLSAAPVARLAMEPIQVSCGW